MNSFIYHIKTCLIGVVFGPAFALGYLFQITKIGFMFGREQSMSLQESMVDETRRRVIASQQKEIDKREKDTGHFTGIV